MSSPITLSTVSLLCKWVMGRSIASETYPLPGDSSFIISAGLGGAECSFESSASDIVPLLADGLRVMTTLATLLHISDLHFGSLEPSAPAPAWLQALRVFQGLLGHRYRATRQLRRFVETTRAGMPTGQLFQLIVTGDLTSMGGDDEFDHASRFLSGPVGLGDSSWREYSVSGNHDQWGGSWPPAANPAPGLATTFPVRFPQVKEPIPLAEGFSLRFVLLDTDADVGWTRRMAAKGHFLSQLEDADKLIPDPLNREIRVVVLHHSRRYGHPNYRSLTLKVRKRSRRALDQFMVSHGIDVALCGHTHCADVETYDAGDSGRPKQRVIHCCCGTTTVRDEIPYNWAFFPNWSLPPNMLLVHEITSNRGKAKWQVTEYMRRPKGFHTHKAHGPFRL